MTPRLVVRWARAPVAADVGAWRAFVEAWPRDRRDRVVFPWASGDARVICEMAGVARRAGFIRIRAERVGGGAVSDREVADLVRGGVNEVAFSLAGAPRAEVLAGLRARGLLAHGVVVVEVPGHHGDLGNPWGADEVEVRVDAGGLGADREGVVGRVERLVAGSAGCFRRVTVRGLALCRIPSLEPERVVSNALEVFAPEGRLDLKFEDPERVYFDVCRTCTRSLACDGFSASEFRGSAGQRVRVRPFGGGRARTVTMSRRGLSVRDHPPTFLSGRVHVWAVAEGVRPAGRVAVDGAHLADQMALIREAGLWAEVVEEPPLDQDRARPGEVHIFFARSREEARRVAEVERAYVRAERGPRPMGVAAFARVMGRALGYPECCIEAFVEAGPEATTEDLLRRAHSRSRRFCWPLNCLDPRSPVLLIPHIPCRFDCGPSLAMAWAVADGLNRVFPGLRGAAEAILKRSIVVRLGGRPLRFPFI